MTEEKDEKNNNVPDIVNVETTPCFIHPTSNFSVLVWLFPAIFHRPAGIYWMSTVVSQKMILTLANGVLEPSDAINELSVFFKACLSDRK